VDPEYTHRRQFYNVVADLVTTMLFSLSSLELRFMIAKVDPDKLYWNHRLVSERERQSRGVVATDLYGTNGQTVEHNRLRDVCDHTKTKLRAEFPQTLPEGNITTICD
jgi:hypothetical protein